MLRQRSLLPGALLVCMSLSCGSERQVDGDLPRAAGASAAPLAQAAPAPAVQPQSSRGSASRGYQGALPPVPMSPYAGGPPEVVRAVYEFAARRPDVLRYVPCFCGCERDGHQDNEDCFVAKRDPDGRPHWDAHGLT